MAKKVTSRFLVYSLLLWLKNAWEKADPRLYPVLAYRGELSPLMAAALLTDDRSVRVDLRCCMFRSELTPRCRPADPPNLLSSLGEPTSS